MITSLTPSATNHVESDCFKNGRRVVVKAVHMETPTNCGLANHVVGLQESGAKPGYAKSIDAICNLAFCA